MEFRILGPLEVSAGDGALRVGGPKQRAVLAHLILHANRPVPIDLLIDGLWGEEPPETARNTLQTYVYRLRQMLGEDRIASEGGGYLLHADPSEIDAARFEATVKAAKAELKTDPSKAAGELTDALALWRGSPLADLSDEPSLRGEIARLEELHLSATEHRIAAEIAMGGHSTVVSELEALTARYPLRERMWANLMLALYRFGRQAEALAAYQRVREVLADELGAEPSVELQHLHEQILRHDPSLGKQEAPRASVKPSRVDLQPATEFAGYRIVRTLGRGGMAVVYLAEHDFLQRKVALKVLAPQLTEDQRFRERFVRESRLAASLDHPNVVPIYEAGASGGDLFIAMRYVEGTDLRTLLAESGALDPARAIAITRQVAAALDAAHEQGLVHRDVKPGNVLVARTRGSESVEHVYLSDFGITKRLTSESGVTGTGQFVGTLDYAAPEQFQGGTPDARTDVYSLGCVLFECLTGHPPFRSENDAGLMYAHLQEPPPSVTAERAELPQDVDGVIAQAMAKAPNDRQPSAGELVDDAARALYVGVPSEPDGAGGPRSRLRMIVPILAVSLALVAGIIVSSLVRNETPEASGETGQTLPEASASSTLAPVFRTVERSLDADERRLLAAIPADVNDDCLPLDRPEHIQNELATLVCSAGEVEVLYELFPTQSDMNLAFQQGVNSHQAPNGECATDTLAASTYAIGGDQAGRVVCYTVEHSGGAFGSPTGQSHIEWTDENSSIYAHAVRSDLGDLSLYEWWLSSSGPVASAGAANAAEKDPPASLGPRLRDGSYLLSVSKRQASRFRPDLFPQLGSAATLEIHLLDGGYQIAADGTVIENGQTLLEKPNAIVFVPASAHCGGHTLVPVTYRWTVRAGAVTWRKTDGNSCAGPQPFTGMPWTRAPQGIAATGAFFLDLRTGERKPLPDGLAGDFIRPSPDGTRLLANSCCIGSLDVATIANIDGTDVRTLDPPGSLNYYNTEWSPDGTKIVYQERVGGSAILVGNVGNLFIEDLVSGQRTQITDLDLTVDSLWDLHPSFSPDGRSVIFHLARGVGTDETTDVWSVPVTGGDPTLVLRNARFPAYFPDGNRIAFVKPDYNWGGPVLRIADAQGNSTKLVEATEAITYPMVSPDGTQIAYHDGGSIYVVDVSSGESSRVADGGYAAWLDSDTLVVSRGD